MVCFFFKQKTAYEMRISDWSSDVCSSDLINPEIVESRGEWGYEEGCLSIPGLSFELVRPAEVHLKGYDLDGNEVSIEADDILARCFQHELDHLDGVLYIERLDDD